MLISTLSFFYKYSKFFLLNFNWFGRSFESKEIYLFCPVYYGKFGTIVNLFEINQKKLIRFENLYRTSLAMHRRIYYLQVFVHKTQNNIVFDY